VRPNSKKNNSKNGKFRKLDGSPPASPSSSPSVSQNSSESSDEDSSANDTKYNAPPSPKKGISTNSPRHLEAISRHIPMQYASMSDYIVPNNGWQYLIPNVPSNGGDNRNYSQPYGITIVGNKPPVDSKASIGYNIPYPIHLMHSNGFVRPNNVESLTVRKFQGRILVN
jgi:hypothetical protein